MSFQKPMEGSMVKLGPGDSSSNPSSTMSLTDEEKRRNKKVRYQHEPRPGYRSGYSVNRSFTQAEIMLLKQILKENGESPADSFSPTTAARGVGNTWPQQNVSHGVAGGSAMSGKANGNTDGTTVFSANEQNPKNRELLTQARKKRTRNVTSPYQTRVLRKVLQLTSFPSTEMRESLAQALNMHPRTVQIWFQNQRQKAKNNPQVSANQNVAGIVPHLDGYGSTAPELVPLPMSPPGSAGGGMFFHNVAMLPNSSSAGVNGNMASAISTPVSQQGLLPGSPYAFMPLYSNASASTPTPASYPSAIYLSPATLQFQGYHAAAASAYPPTPTSLPQVSPQQAYPSPTATSPTDEFTNPTLDMLAAAALEAESDPNEGDNPNAAQQHHVYAGKGANVHHQHHHQHQASAMCTSPVVDTLRQW